MKKVIVGGSLACALLTSCAGPSYPVVAESPKEPPISQVGHYPSHAASPLPQPPIKSVDPILRIRYVPFHELAPLIPQDKRELPDDLERLITLLYSRMKPQNPDRFESEVWAAARSLGYTSEDVSMADPCNLAKIAVAIVGKRLTYFDVDNDSEFIAKYGAHLPTDDYFHLGKGDCDKYADATVDVLNLLKCRTNDARTRNLYATRDLGGNTIPHAWVSLFVPLSAEEVLISHIDPTFANNGGALEVSAEHVDVDCVEYRCLMWLGRYARANELIGSVLEREMDPERRAEILSDRANNSRCLKLHAAAAKDYDDAAILSQADGLKVLYLSCACEEYYRDGQDHKVIEVVERARAAQLSDNRNYEAMLLTGWLSSKRVMRADLERAYRAELLARDHEDVSKNP